MSGLGWGRLNKIQLIKAVTSVKRGRRWRDTRIEGQRGFLSNNFSRKRWRGPVASAYEMMQGHSCVDRGDEWDWPSLLA